MTHSQEAVIYCRVSSSKQKTEGHGLESQETRCLEYANYQGYKVVAAFKDDLTGASVHRPAMEAMLRFLKQSRKSSSIVIIDDITRLARDIDAHRALRKAIIAAGGILKSPNMDFGDDPEKELVENISASVSHHARRANARQTKSRMRARVMGGYWCFPAPIGYEYRRVAGHGKLLVPHEPYASILREALQGYATGRFDSLAEVMRFLALHPEWPQNRRDSLSIQVVTEMLNRPHYAGYIDLPEWGVNMLPAKHEALIDFSTYQAIQNRMNGGRKVPARKDLNEDFPLRGFVTCGCCGTPLRASWSTGRKQRYAYYVCQIKGCDDYGKSIPRHQIEGEFETMLKAMRPTRTLFEIATDMFRIACDDQVASTKTQIKALEAELKKIEGSIVQFLDRVITADSHTLANAYENRIRSLEERKAEVRDQITKQGRPRQDFEAAYRTAMNFLANPWKLWASDRYEDKRAVLKLTFSERLVYERGKGYRTAVTSWPFTLLSQFQGVEKGMVPPVGLEPTHLAVPDFESGASTNSTTGALRGKAVC